jgi:hypothetical protein
VSQAAWWAVKTSWTSKTKSRWDGHRLPALYIHNKTWYDWYPYWCHLRSFRPWMASCGVQYNTGLFVSSELLTGGFLVRDSSPSFPTTQKSFLIQGKKKGRKDNGAVLYVTSFSTENHVVLPRSPSVCPGLVFKSGANNEQTSPGL